MSKPTPQTVRRKFDATFKREAVQNWLQSGKAAHVVAQELGVTANLLYSWRNRFAPAAAGGGAAAGAEPRPPAGLQGQLGAGLRGNRHLREEGDIFKKKVGI